jgi:glycosyltransferase involved in cell wall biosynthesis
MQLYCAVFSDSDHDAVPGKCLSGVLRVPRGSGARALSHHFQLDRHDATAEHRRCAREYGRESPLEALFLGWVDREKGIFELLECAQLLSESGDVPAFKVIIAGDGSAMAETRRKLNDPRLGSVVELLGWIDSDAKVERLRRAHLLVLPSYMEGMPNAIIEAMATGLPVVATDVGAVGDVVCDGVNGFLIPPRDIDRLAKALRQLLLDAPLRERMGRAGWHIAKGQIQCGARRRSARDTGKSRLRQKRASLEPAS